MTFTIAFTDIVEVMDETDLSKFGITSGATTKLNRAATTSLNEIMSVIGQRKAAPATLPTSGGSRWAFLMVARYRIYATRPESLIVTSPGGGLRKHPVAEDYDRALAQAAAVAVYETDWPELDETTVETSTGIAAGAWGSDERIADTWDGIAKQGDGADDENEDPFGDFAPLGVD